MATMVSLMEAASFLGVSRATLRNWDNDGKLNAIRNPVNGYRLYNLDELVALKGSTSPASSNSDVELSSENNSKAIKRLINKLHSIIRDSDANSNIISRFDEISKLLFIKLYAEKTGDSIFMQQILESDDSYKERLQKKYDTAINNAGIIIPEAFKEIRLSSCTVSKCGLELSRIDFSTSGCDIKGIAYEDTIRGTFDKSDNQQYFTPYQIVDFMVQMIVPYIHGCVCDPACGTGGFLNKVADSCPNVELLGFEVDERLAWVSNLNLLIHGNTNFSVYALPDGGSLGNNCRPYFDKADIVITNPPFGSDYNEYTLLANYSLGYNHSSRRRGILFLEQIWNLLNDEGIVAIIIDQSVLNAKTTIDVRQFLITHYHLMGVIDLPDTAFMPYANVSTSILIMKKMSQPVKQNSVFYARSHCIGRKNNGDDDLLYSDDGSYKLNSDLPEIIKQWERFQSGEKILNKECFVADVTANLSDDDTLRLDYVYHHPYRKESQKLLNECKYTLFSLAEVCIERNESYIPSSDGEATTIQFTGLANIEPYIGKATRVITPAASIKSAVKRYEKNDIVFSKMRPALRKTAVMKFEDGGYVSSECTVFSVRKNEKGDPIILPDLLCALLRSDLIYGQIMSCITGIGRPRIGNKDLRNIKIPVPPIGKQEKVLLTLNAAISSAYQLREKAQLLYDEANALEQKSLNDVAITMFGEL